MKKILFMIPDLAGGGAEKVLVNLVNNMDKNKYDITVKSLFDVGVNKDFLKPHIKREYCFKRQFRGNSHVFKLFSPKFLYKQFLKSHYDVIVSYLEGPTTRIISGCTDNDTKLVAWIHCKMDDEISASVGFRNFNEAKKGYYKYDKVVAVSEWTREYFTKTFAYKNHVDVLYNTNETKKIIDKSKELVDDVDITNDCINICSVGKIAEVKGFDRLARIHKRLIDDGIKNRIYILGEGAQRKEIESYLEKEDLRNTFRFLGYKENPYKYVSKFDLYVCASLSEGFSTSVTESLIVGTPVVTTLCSGMQEMLGENNEYGIVTENNEDALYEGIKRIISEEGLLEHYREMAIERGKFFDTKNTIKAVEEMLDSL